MTTIIREKNLSVVLAGLFGVLSVIGISGQARASVVIIGDAGGVFDTGVFWRLDRPTGKPDETSLGGFNYWISSRVGDFRENDQYLNEGDETDTSTAIAANLGTVTNLSGVPFDFSIEHVTNKNFSFSLTNSGTPSVLCWGIDCPGGSISSPTLNGKPPITNFNGLQLQFRAQDVANSTTEVRNLALSGVDIDPMSDAWFDGVVTPTTDSTIDFDPPGRVGQWIMGYDLASMDWVLSGTVTLTRDEADSDRNKVRLAVDFVRDPTLVPVPAALPLFVTAIGFLAAFVRRRRSA